MKKGYFLLYFVCVLLFSSVRGRAQGIQWVGKGNEFYQTEAEGLVKINLESGEKQSFVTAAQLTPSGKKTPLFIKSFSVSEDGKKVLIFTNSVRVWRYETRGDYWLLDLNVNTLEKIAKTLPASSLMFAKLSPDQKSVAFVHERNLYVQTLEDDYLKKLTTSVGEKQINGTFDWVYEEEFECRDGFRWSPDSKRLAFWQIDASQVKNFQMINNTDNIYPTVTPVEYPKVGELPSPFKIGVVEIENGRQKFIEFDAPTSNTYLPRLEWANNSQELILQQLNRKQNHSKLLYADVETGKAKTFYEEHDNAWIDLKQDGTNGKGYFDWSNSNESFYWTSEKSGWRHIYKISRNGKQETCLTCPQNGEKDFE